MNNINLETFKPGTSLVLIRLAPVDDTIKTASGFELSVDISYDKERHAVVHGTVIMVPDLIFVDTIVLDGGKLAKKIVQVKDALVRPGDTAYFDINAVQLAEKWHTDGGVFENMENGVKVRYCLIPYHYLICYLSAGKLPIKSINNHVIADQIEVKTEKDFIEGYGNAIINKESNSPILLLQWEKHKRLFAKVVASPVDSGLSEGETIIYEQESDVCIENSYNITLPKRYIYMKLDDVFCTMVDGFPMPFSNKVVINPEPIKEYAGRFYIPEIARKQHRIGTVNEIGPEVTDVKVGDRICFIIEGSTILETGEYMVREPEVIAILPKLES